MPEYIAYYPWADAPMILTAQASKFPRRADKYQAAQDAQRWRHTQGEVLIPYRIEADGTVVPMKIWVHRVMEVVDAVEANP